VFPWPKYKSLCDWCTYLMTCVLSALQHTLQHTLRHTHHMTCVLSALSRGCLACHFPHHRHDTTGCVNHTPTILHPGTNLYSQKFWPEIPKLSHVQICSQVQDCWRMVHTTSCIMPCNGGNIKQDSPCWVQTAHKSCDECVAVCVAVQTAHKSCDECFNRTSFCMWSKGTQIWAIETVLAKVTIAFAPLCGPTVWV